MGFHFVNPNSSENTMAVSYTHLDVYKRQIERFIGILIEHYAGKFPAWLAPVQVKVLPISDKNAAYAKNVYDAFCLLYTSRCV